MSSIVSGSRSKKGAAGHKAKTAKSESQNADPSPLIDNGQSQRQTERAKALAQYREAIAAKSKA